MKRKILAILAVMLMGAGSLTATPVMALGGGNCGTGQFLGFKAWYDGLCDGNTKESKVEAPEKDGDGKDLTLFVWTIVLNVLFDISLVVGYVALAMVIYGGYMYIMSQGDLQRAARGKRTLVTAITGTAIAMGASVIINTLTFVLGLDRNGGLDQGEFNAERLQNVFNWAYSMAGLVAVIFIVKGGFDYMLSKGNPEKIQQATRGIQYAVIGLIVVILAALITGVVINSLGGALA